MKNIVKSLVAILLVATTLTTFAQRRHDIEFVSNIPAGRNILVQPQLGHDRPFKGKIAVDFTINRKGDVIAAHVNRRASTIRNRQYIAHFEEAVMGAKFSKIKHGPQTQQGRLTYSF
ncbi:MAG: hypothetical protein ABI367_09270 [Mucilaginibacter sp.]